MNFEKYLRQEQIKKDATEAASKSVNDIVGKMMRSEFDTLEQYQESMKEFNENTRMGFEEFIQSHGSDRNKLQLRCTPYTSKKGGYGSFDLDFGLCVYKHQQSKVDELQKRVDESLRILVDIKKKGLIGSQYSIFDLEQALKGGEP